MAYDDMFKSITGLAASSAFAEIERNTRLLAEAMRPPEILGTQLAQLSAFDSIAAGMPRFPDSFAHLTSFPSFDYTALSGVQRHFEELGRTVTEALKPPAWAMPVPDYLTRRPLDDAVGLGSAFSEAMRSWNTAFSVPALASATAFERLGLNDSGLAASRAIADMMADFGRANALAFREATAARMALDVTVAQQQIREMTALNGRVEPQGRSLLIDGLAIIEGDLAAASTIDEASDALARLMGLFLARLAKTKSAFESQGITNVIALLSLVIAAMAYVQSTQVPNVRLEVPVELRETLEGLKSAVEERLIPSRRPEAVVLRTANLRHEPGRRGEILRQVFVGDVVEIGESASGWTQVTAYDAVADKLVEGWVYARYLRPITASVASSRPTP